MALPPSKGILSTLRNGGERKRVKRLIEELQEIPASERVDVPYPPNVGVVWRTGGNTETFWTGATPEQRAIDCNVVVIKGSERSGMMHVSSQTMPDEYVNRRVSHPYNTDVDQQVEAMLVEIGGGDTVESIAVVAGDTTLARELEQFLTGGENVWGSGSIGSPVASERIRIIDAGTDQKLVVAKPNEGTLQVAHLSSRPKLEELSL